MKYYVFIYSFIFVIGLGSIHAQELFSLESGTLYGNTYSFAECKGTKSMFVVLASDPKDSMHLQLINFAKEHSDKLKIFGLIDADNKSTEEQHQAIYKLYSPYMIILLKPSILSKTQNDNQAPLLKWLTHKELNHHFDKDAKEPQTRFFVDETGRLYSVLSRHAGWDTPFIRQVINAKKLSTSL